MAVTRRVFSAGLIVFNLVIKHDAAHAQAAILSKIPWGRIMEGLGSGISFLLIIYDHLPVRTSNDAVCSLGYSDYDHLYDNARDLWLQINSRNDEPVIEDGDAGVIPEMVRYLSDDNIRQWKTLKHDLVLSLHLMNEFLQSLLTMKDTFDKVNPDGWKDVEPKLINAIHEARVALSYLSMANDSPTHNAGIVTETLGYFRPLPGNLSECLKTITKIKRDRLDANCH
jgi:hypothetical protein